jgi:hypothetical protein
MLALVLRTTEFFFYHVFLLLVDRASLPRDTTVPEAMRLYRENIALKAQLDALERYLVMLPGSPSCCASTMKSGSTSLPFLMGAKRRVLRGGVGRAPH